MCLKHRLEPDKTVTCKNQTLGILRRSVSSAISLAAPKYRFNFEAGYIGGPTGNIQLMNFVQSSFFSIKKRTRKKETQKDLMSFTESFQLFPLD